MEYRSHLQAFIDRWRYNANRGRTFCSLMASAIFDLIITTAAQAQMKIKILEKVNTFFFA